MSEQVDGGKPLQQMIAKRAHEIWLEEGCPSGWDLRHWLQAEAELLLEEAEQQQQDPG